MPKIHPTALVDPQAQLAEDVSVGPYSIIGPRVRIGRGSAIAAHVVIDNRTTIGEGNRIAHHVTLGQEPQDLKYGGEASELVIGDRNEIREHVTMHIGTDNGGGSTRVGSDNLLMVGVHIAHDSHIGDHSILANHIMLAGHTRIQDYAVISGGTGLTHYVTVGRYAFIGGMAGVVHDCPPFMICDGHPAKVRGLNAVGLERHGFNGLSIERLKHIYRTLYGPRGRREGRIEDILDYFQSQYPDDPNVGELIDFVRRSVGTVNGRYAEVARRDDKHVAPTR